MLSASSLAPRCITISASNPNYHLFYEHGTHPFPEAPGFGNAYLKAPRGVYLPPDHTEVSAVSRRMYNSLLMRNDYGLRDLQGGNAEFLYLCE